MPNRFLKPRFLKAGFFLYYGLDLQTITQTITRKSPVSDYGKPRFTDAYLCKWWKLCEFLKLSFPSAQK